MRKIGNFSKGVRWASLVRSHFTKRADKNHYDARLMKSSFKLFQQNGLISEIKTFEANLCY